MQITWWAQFFNKALPTYSDWQACKTIKSILSLQIRLFSMNSASIKRASPVSDSKTSKCWLWYKFPRWDFCFERIPSLSYFPWQEMCNTRKFFRIISTKLRSVATLTSSLRATFSLLAAPLMILSSSFQLIFDKGIDYSVPAMVRNRGDANKNPTSISFVRSHEVLFMKDRLSDWRARSWD